MNAASSRSDDLLEALRQVIDPELGCNIVDLGLVYDVALEAGHATVTMTLTTPGCPMNEAISAGVKHVLLAEDGVAAVEVRIVWEPPWTPDRMSAAAKRLVGLTEPDEAGF
jgi:metal-sulfur cluster biosynthetic enzyme